jgi:hypothetical protein
VELVAGSGNVFRDLDHPRADVKQLKSILAAALIIAESSPMMTA